MCISDVTDISPGKLDSSLRFIQPGISPDVQCIQDKQTGWQHIALMYSFPNMEPVCCSMSSFNCCFLMYIQVSLEANKVVWYSHLLKNFPVCFDPHSQRLRIVNKGDVFLEFSCFFMIHWVLAIWSLVPLPYLNPAWTSGSSRFMYCWSLTWRILNIM